MNEGDGIEELLPGICDTVGIETPRADELLSQLKLISQLLSEAPPPIAGPSLIFRDRNGLVVTRSIGSRLAFGRSSGCDLAYPLLREISRNHFVIAPNAGEYVLTDAGSANGTYIRGRSERIVTHPLREGDVIEAAGFIFVFLRS